MRLVFGWILLIGLLLGRPALAQRVDWTAPPESAGPQLLVGQMRMLVDPTARLDIAALQALPEAAWQPARPQTLTPGYSAAAYWLRLDWHNPDSLALQRWLLLRPARLESVRLYTTSEAGALHEQRAGTEQAFGLRELPLRESAFALRLAPGERQTLWLRVASRSAIAIEPTLWPAHDLLWAEQARLWLDGGLIGLSALLCLIALVIGLVWRERAYVYIAFYLASFVFYESGMRGTAFMLFWPEATDWALRALGSFGVLAQLTVLAAITRLLRTARYQPRLHGLLMGLAGLNLLVLFGCLLGDYALATQLASAINGALSLLLLLTCWRALRQRRPLAAVLGLTLLLQMLGMLPRLASLLGWQPHSLLVDYGPPLAGIVGCLVVLLALVGRALRERRRHQQALEEAVQQRTAELAEASARAQASDAAKGRLLGYIGHDLRAPLASVVQLARQLTPGEGFESDRRAIEHSSHLLLELIDELQRFARAPQASAAPELLPAPVYLHGLLHELAQQAEGLARSGGNRLSLHLAPGLPTVLELDAKRLRQVLFNLLSNAAKFSRAGSIRLRAGYADGRLALAVEDDGPGIALELQQQVFEPFMRAAASAQLPGLGLGLAIARQAVRAMGGELRLHSRPGEGCRFEFDLAAPPASEEEVGWPVLRELGALEPVEQGLALVLDASAQARAALSERLGVSGYDCLQAPDLAQAMSQGLALPAGALRMVLVEPLSIANDLAALAPLQRAHPGLRLLICSARPDADAALYKPAPTHVWWAALRV
ncbi:MAG: sensor histidine kinase [Paucibacter sp.]|nr:sensor histidine kinase [Roseateles sp.]